MSAGTAVSRAVSGGHTGVFVVHRFRIQIRVHVRRRENLKYLFQVYCN
jgi:hypothetical protein